MYNELIKKRFLNQYEENTAKTYQRIFEFSQNAEEQLKKDLYNFSRSETKIVFWDMNPLTKNAAVSYGNIVRMYIRWAIENGLRRNNDNPLEYVTPDYFGQFVDKEKRLYLTERQLRIVENNVVNAQDAVIFRLMFEGVNGKHMSELRNLKKSDVNFNENKLTLTDLDGETRELIVSDRAIKFIGKAIDQEIYEMNNGEMPATSRHDGMRELDSSDFVLRGTLTNLKSKGEAVGKNIIYKRIKNVMDHLGFLDIEAVHYFSSKNIQRSGMIYYAKNILEQKGQITNQDYQDIADRFGIQTLYVVRNICSIEMINKVYGDQK